MPPRKPRVLIVGPGAIGRTIARRLAGRAEVRLLGRNDKTPPRRLSADAVFLCVKARDVSAALRGAKPYAGPDSAVVALQNGIGHERLVRRAFGPERTVIGAAFIAAERRATGEVVHHGGDSAMLARSPRNAAAVAAARAILEKARLEVDVRPSEDGVLWTKAAVNAAINPVGALCAAPSGRLAEDPALRDLALRALAEALRAARRARKPIYLKNPEETLLRACRAVPNQKNSMLQDLEAGRPTEAEAILGPIIAAGRRASAPTPLLRDFRRLLAKLERWSGASRS